MFQVNLGVVYSTVHTIPSSLHPSIIDRITLLFLFPVLSSICLSLKTKCINRAPTRHGGQRGEQYPAPALKKSCSAIESEQYGCGHRCVRRGHPELRHTAGRSRQEASRKRRERP